MLPILNNGAAIDEDMRDARRVAVWIVVGREVQDALAREGHDVGLGPLPDDAPIPETQPRGGKPGHLVYRRLEREHVLVTRVAAKHARESAIAPRMGLALGHGTARRQRRAVGADHDTRVDQGTAKVGLVELEKNDIATSFLSLDHIEGDLDRVLAPALRDLVEAESLNFRT